LRSVPSSAKARPPPTQSTSSSARQQRELMPVAVKLDCLKRAMMDHNAQQAPAHPSSRLAMLHPVDPTDQHAPSVPKALGKNRPSDQLAAREHWRQWGEKAFYGGEADEH